MSVSSFGFSEGDCKIIISGFFEKRFVNDERTNTRAAQYPDCSIQFIDFKHDYLVQLYADPIASLLNTVSFFLLRFPRFLAKNPDPR